jgi:hypothetical protein
VLVEIDVDVISRAVESSVRVSYASAEARQSDLIALQRQTRRYDEPVPVTLIALIELGERNLFGALEVGFPRKEQPQRTIGGARVAPEFFQHLPAAIAKGAHD